jgi:hypothetical protein
VHLLPGVYSKEKVKGMVQSRFYSLDETMVKLHVGLELIEYTKLRNEEREGVARRIRGNV